jgi:hypothetical protein
MAYKSKRQQVKKSQPKPRSARSYLPKGEGTVKKTERKRTAAKKDTKKVGTVRRRG